MPILVDTFLILRLRQPLRARIHGGSKLHPFADDGVNYGTTRGSDAAWPFTGLAGLDCRLCSWAHVVIDALAREPALALVLKGLAAIVHKDAFVLGSKRLRHYWGGPSKLICPVDF